MDSGVRIHVSHAGRSSAQAQAQTNTHIHLGINTNQDLRPRTSVRISHAVRSVEVVDLSNILATEDIEDSAMVNAQFDSVSQEDASNIAFDVDDDVVEDPEDGIAEEDGGEERHAKESVSKTLHPHRV